MRAVVCRGPRDYVVEQVDDPRAGDDEAVLRVEAVGICASDVKCFQGAPMFWGDDTRPRYVEPPVVPGHEFVGRVVQIGHAAAARWGVREGDRVTVEQIVPCEQCWYCRRGFYRMCRENDIFGFHQSVHGAMAEYVRVPSRARVHRISPDLPAAHAAFAEPLSCSLHAVERADVGFEDTVVIAGPHRARHGGGRAPAQPEARRVRRQRTPDGWTSPGRAGRTAPWTSPGPTRSPRSWTSPTGTAATPTSTRPATPPASCKA